MTHYTTPTRQPATCTRLPRRDWLKAAAIACLGAPAMAAPAADWRTKAKKNLRLGIYSGVYSSLPLEEAAARMRAPIGMRSPAIRAG